MCRPLLVLDIDETLLYAATQPLTQPHDYKAERTWIYKRPFVDRFLRFCQQHFQIGVWTSARASYANEIFSQVFPFVSPLFIRSEQHCLDKKNEHGHRVSIKPIHTLAHQGHDLKQILVIDDSPEKHTYTPDNLIPITPYYGDKRDSELKQLIHFLDSIKHHHNLLPIEKYNWRQTQHALSH